MKSFLFTLGLALCCFVQAEEKEVITIREEDMGSWVTIAAACSSYDILEQLRNLSAFITELSIPREDVFSMWVLYPMPDGCKNATYEFGKEKDGKYRSGSGESKMTLESLTILNGSLISTINALEMTGEKFRTTMLYSRNGTRDQEVLQKFKDKCKTLDYRNDQVEILTLPVKCQKEQ